MNKSHRGTFWQLDALQRKIEVCHLRCITGNKSLNVRGRWEVANDGKDGHLPSLAVL